jgi:hypothetical protein
MTTCLKWIYRDTYIRYIFDVFQEAMAKKRLADLKDDTSARIAKMVRLEIVKKGQDEEERKRRLFRSALNFYAQANFENAKNGSKFLIGQFMRIARVKKEMNDRF